MLLTPWLSLQHPKSQPLAERCFFTDSSFKLCNSLREALSLLSRNMAHSVNKRWSKKREIWREVQRYVMKREKETAERSRELPPRARLQHFGTAFACWLYNPAASPCSMGRPCRRFSSFPTRLCGLFDVPGSSTTSLLWHYSSGMVCFPLMPEAPNSQHLSNDFMPFGSGPRQALPV